MIYTVLDDGKADTGVDAVAEDSGTRDRVAIQRKLDAQGRCLPYRDIDMFLAGSLPSLDVTES